MDPGIVRASNISSVVIARFVPPRLSPIVSPLSWPLLARVLDPPCPRRTRISEDECSVAPPRSRRATFSPVIR